MQGLQSLVNANAAVLGSSAIQILCPFNWNKTPGGNNDVLSGQTPSSQSFFSAYNDRLAEMAKQFAGQSNVWPELWNEPYSSVDPKTSSGGSLWLQDMETMVSSIRNGTSASGATGYKGVILVPAADWSGDETVIKEYGQQLENFDPQHNLVFDLHAYSNFIQNQTASQIEARITSIQSTGCPFIFGEFGAAILGGSGYDDVSPFLTAVEQKGISALAWNWNDNDGGTLHNSDGSLNNTTANFDWSNQVLAFTQGTSGSTPTIQSGPNVNPSPVAGTSATLSVLGSDTGTGGEAGLSYTWSEVSGPSGAAAATFLNGNGTNAAKTMGVEFHEAGTYRFQVNVSNGTNATASTLAVAVEQTPTSVPITAAAGTVTAGKTDQLTATVEDQFGMPIVGAAVEWSVVSGGGVVSAAGLFTAPASGTTSKVEASSGGASSELSLKISDGAVGTGGNPPSALEAKIAAYSKKITQYDNELHHIVHDLKKATGSEAASLAKEYDVIAKRVKTVEKERAALIAQR